MSNTLLDPLFHYASTPWIHVVRDLGIQPYHIICINLNH